MKFKLTSLEKKWVLYDVGNSAFTMMVSTIFPIYFNYLAGNAGISDVDYLAYWGYATSVCTLLVAILGPTLGAIADTKNFKKTVFFVAMGVGVFGCILLGFLSSWIWFLGIFVLAKTGYSASLIFYDAMLTDVTDPERMDAVSSHGYAWGYIGSCIPFVACLGVVLGAKPLGIGMQTAMIIAFIITALWWLLSSVPLLRSYRQKYFAEVNGHVVKDSFKRLGKTFAELVKEKHIFVFLLAFLPIVLLLYYLCPARLRNLVLLVFSLVFYAWGEPVYVLIMLFSIVFDYANGRLIEHFKNKNCPGKAKAALIVDLCGNLAILGFFKYTDFVIGSINSITGAGLSLLHIALPIGISFYTFQTMSYTIDVYRGEVAAQKNILTFATYVTLFPQLIAGPIVQYKTVEKELMHRKVTLEDFSEGAFRFSVGLAKKVLLANQIGSLWNSISQLNHMSVATAWLGAIAYSFQIYFDFSGYSDMAIGLGRMFGFYFLENFNFPYMSKTITEFWRRWHISLSSWFREYVYIPLGGNRKGLVRQLFNIMVVWMLTGLWHGANWNFVLWGVYYGVLLMIEKLFLLKWLDKLPNWIGHIYSMFLVVIGWTIFAQTDIHQLGEYLKTMFGIGHVAVADSDFLYFLGSNAVLLVALIAASIDYRVWMRRLKLGKDATVYDTIATSKGWTIAKPVLMVVFLLVSFAFLVGDSYNPFLYFRF